MRRTLARAAAGLCLALALFFLLPLCAGILHFGMLWPAAALMGAAAVLLWPDFFRRLLRPKWLRRLVNCVIAVCMTAILVTVGAWLLPPLTVPPRGRNAPWWCWAVRCTRTDTPA